MVNAVTEADLPERLDRALLPVMTVAAVDQRELDVLDRVEAGEQVERLEHEADVLVADRRELIVAQLADDLARERVYPRIRCVEAAEHVHQRRLARAGRAHDRHELAGVDVEVDALQRLDLDLLADAVRLRDPTKLHDRLGRRTQPAR